MLANLYSCSDNWYDSQLPCLTLSIKCCVENKPVSLLVGALGKVLSEIPPFLSGRPIRQMAGNSYKQACYSALIAFSSQEDKHAATL